ncbi:hypothetical protein LguiB_029128 [Lonicera macranthoides]
MNLTTLLITQEMSNFLFLLIIPSLIFIFIFKKISSKGPPIPPGPYSWPIIGNFYNKMGKEPHVTLANLAQVHGPLMSVRFGAQLVVVGSSPAAAAEILKTNDRSLSGRFVSSGVRVKGSKLHNLQLSLFDECGDGWRSVRGIYR